ncbi:MAPEG family protein [Pseudidiomarina sp.]|uniref:MAPEG family protein n=1 Tax=Pseudidiomarina sp. TaxID=2081707 RepID=UPI00299DF381|nr:MAPEG family protein [Pseudidiomarina sp.]MDX1705068.1 MAPEG family protein [Pseudidiomarina sp.]
MSILIWCLLIAGLLPIAAKAPVVYYQNAEQSKGYDNRHPRAQQQRLTGIGARAVAGHYNAYEAFPLFAAAVLLVIATRQVSDFMVLLAVGFIIFRVAYHVLYLLNFATLRSLIWFFALLCPVIMIAQTAITITGAA